MCTSNYAGSACTRNGYTSGAYGNGESCSISFGSSKPLSVYTFNTETNYDKLTVNGVVYMGTNNPGGQTASSMHWHTDGSVVQTGWKICVP